MKDNKDPNYHICKATNSPITFDSKVSKTCVLCGFPDVEEKKVE